jgi:hypothetical protein
VYAAYVSQTEVDNYINAVVLDAAGGGDALLLTGALWLPDLDEEPAAPASGALLYSFGGVARVVDANGARDL